jgi:predicted ATPase/class 3 adenylate cyclase
MSDQPAGIVTFLFSDIEGSTQLWERQPLQMEDALERHDRIMRAAIEARRGYVFSTAGDAFAAAFTWAQDAVSAAADAQLALSTERWPPETQLRVRIGVHTGESQERGGDYFGATLNRAARIMSAANGGQVFLSAVTHELVAERLDGDFRLIDVGEHRLKDVRRPERLYQLSGGDLEEVGLPPRTATGVPGNLPTLLRPFVGRQRELAELGDLLERSRLVSIVGAPGCGKTRLAIEAASLRSAVRAGSSWIADLTAEHESTGVAEAVARAVDVSPEASVPPEQAVADALRDRPAVLVLDNCEGALEAVGRLATQLLQTCPELLIVATSRERLGLATEQVFALSPMSTNAGEHGEADAVALFVERALAHGARGDVLERNRGAIVELCEHLDGLPLAIELAAARTRSLEPSQLLERLGQRFRLLTPGRRATGEGRYRTVRDAIDWSYGLLDEHERELFDWLGVFSGAFEPRDAAAVTGSGADELDVIDDLAGLVERSLVVSDSSLPLGFRMLETLRVYARERLRDRGQEAVALHRHARWFATKAREVRASLVGPNHVERVDRLVQQAADYRGAATWALAQDEPALAVELVSLYCGSSYYRVGYDALSWLGPSPESLTSADRPGSVELLGLLARSARFGGDAERADTLARRSVNLDSGPESAQAQSQLALAAAARGEIAEGIRWAEGVIEVSEAGHDDLGILLGSLILGPLLASDGRIDEAIGVADRLLALGMDRESEHARGWAHLVHGSTLSVQDPLTAREHLDTALALGRAEKNRYLESNALLAKLDLMLVAERPAEAAQAALDTLDELDEASDNGFFVRILLGELATYLARLEQPAAVAVDAYLERFTFTAPARLAQRRRRVVDRLTQQLDARVVDDQRAAGASAGIDDARALAGEALRVIMDARSE